MLDKQCGLVVQLVRMPACHAGGRRFEPVPGRQFFRNLRGTLYCVNKYAKIEIAKAEHINLTVNCIILAKVNRLYGGYRQVVKTQGCGSCIRGFESHYPPHLFNTLYMRRHSQVVRQRSAKPLFPSSNLGVASKMLGYRQAVRQRILIPSCAGSNPATLANNKGKA